MLNIGGGELLIILLVALVFLGPQRLPEVARQVGQTVTTLRGLARGFQAEIEAAARPDALTAPSTSTEATDPFDRAAKAREAAKAGESDPAEGDTAPDTAAPDTDALASEARAVDTSDEAASAVAPVSDGGPIDLRAGAALDDERAEDLASEGLRSEDLVFDGGEDE